MEQLDLFDEDRMKVVSQNGNDGLHYEEIIGMGLEDAYDSHLDREDFSPHVTEVSYDSVLNPKHYQLIPEKNIQAIDVIRAVLTPEEFRGYCRGNQIKYALRNKGNRIEDAGKCKQYIDFELE